MEKIKLIKGFLWIRYGVFDNLSLNGSDIMVYAVLMRYMNNDTKKCYPSIKVLAEKSRLHRDTVFKSLKKLEEENLIYITKDEGRVNHYCLLEPTSAKNPTSRNKDLQPVGIKATNNTNPNYTNKTLCATPEQKEIIAYLNEKLENKPPRGFKDNNQQTLKLLNARLKDYTKADILAVIDVKCEQWAENSGMRKFLRPATLFNVNKFESYVNEINVEGSESRCGGAMPLQILT